MKKIKLNEKDKTICETVFDGIKGTKDKNTHGAVTKTRGMKEGSTPLDPLGFLVVILGFRPLPAEQRQHGTKALVKIR